MKKIVFSLMDRMFNFIPEEAKGNERYVIFFNSDKEPIILIDDQDDDITFSGPEIKTVMSIMGVSLSDLTEKIEGINLNEYILEWANQEFDGHYEIKDWYISNHLLSYLG
jgi:hypothetical protein